MTIEFRSRKFGVVLWLAGLEGSWGIGDADSLVDLFVRVDEVLDVMIASPQTRVVPRPELRMTFLNESIQYADSARVEIEKMWQFKQRSGLA